MLEQQQATSPGMTTCFCGGDCMTNAPGLLAHVCCHDMSIGAQCINFHTDHSLHTCQVALTDAHTYSCGDLIFVNAKGL
eukprot:SAG11_NODE_8630_length_993_cov_1.728188_1_plen_78_part_10